MTVLVKREGKYHVQSYKIGKPDHPVKEISLAEVKKIIPKYHKHLLKSKSGTLTIYHPDPKIFKKNTQYSFNRVRKQLRERAYLIAGVYLHLKTRVH